MEQLWLNYVGVGGTLDPAALSEAVREPDSLDNREHDTIAQAINEHYLDHGGDHPTAYRDSADEVSS